MVAVAITIAGEPKPKERPRLNRKTGHFYTPRATSDYENLVAWHARASRQHHTGPVRVDLVFYTANTVIDLDNAVKAAVDGLANGGAFVNDRQVRELHARFADPAGEPRTEVTITAL